MRICCLSDLHGHLPIIESCDILIIAGDICPHAPKKTATKFGATVQYLPPVGQHEDLTYQAMWLDTKFREWLDLVPAKDTVATPGNHDFVFERARQLLPIGLRWHLLMDDVKAVQGMKIYGSPYQHYYSGWAFNAPPRDEGGEDFLERKFSMIPDDTDIIIVHGPPYSLGDAAPNKDGVWERTGSVSLMSRIMAIKPKLSVHGHIHLGRGAWSCSKRDNVDTLVVNASICNESNEPVHPPLYFDI